MKDRMTWEEAVLKFRSYATKESVEQCYFHEDVMQAGTDFYSSEEFKETLSLAGIESVNKLKILDLGAGNGIASYAFAKLGGIVTAVEPDASNVVGAGAISELNQHLTTENRISIVSSFGENLPFQDSSFDVVYARQVLHHAHNLDQLVSQCARVLKPAGYLITIRDHVISTKEDLPKFLENHLLHKYYGGENAFLLDEYRSAFLSSGFKILKQIDPLASVINYFPSREKQISMKIRGLLKESWNPLMYYLTKILYPKHIISLFGTRASYLIDDPGRLYSFICKKITL